jgi:hypothetical protein
MEAILKRHEEAFGDEHDEDCPLCGVDAQEHDLDEIVVDILRDREGEDDWDLARKIVAAIMRELDGNFRKDD